MRKRIAAISVTLDGFCDHTARVPNEEEMHFLNDQVHKADTLLFRGITH